MNNTMKLVEQAAQALHGKLFATITDWREEMCEWPDLPDATKREFQYAASAALEAAGIESLQARVKCLEDHWRALDQILHSCHVENDRPDRVRWEGEWHYGPAATAMNSVMRSLKKMTAVVLANQGGEK